MDECIASRVDRETILIKRGREEKRRKEGKKRNERGKTGKEKEEGDLPVLRVIKL